MLTLNNSEKIKEQSKKIMGKDNHCNSLKIMKTCGKNNYLLKRLCKIQVEVETVAKPQAVLKDKNLSKVSSFFYGTSNKRKDINKIFIVTYYKAQLTQFLRSINKIVKKNFVHFRTTQHYLFVFFLNDVMFLR